MNFLVIIVLLCLLGSCGKKKNIRLAQNYYRLAMLELTDEACSVQSYKKALKYIDQALQQDCRADFLAVKGTLLFELKHIDESAETFKQALEICQDPGLKAEILNNYACLLAFSNKFDEAEKIWQSLINNKHYLTPEVACVNQGKMAIDRHDYLQAKTHFLKALAFAPSYLDAHYYVALTACALDDTSLAKQSVKTVLYLEPQHRGAQNLALTLGIS